MSRRLPEKRLTEINTQLSSLQSTIESIKRELISGRDTIRHMLHRRGYTVLRENSKENLILPVETIENGEDRFYEMLKKYSFRIFLRDVIRLKQFTLRECTRYSSEGTVRNYLNFSEEMGIVKRRGSRYNLIPDTVYSFGDTLEWFIAQIYRREFFSDSSWEVKVKDTKAGGDFDVISSVEGYLVYTEVKSSPPKHIEIEEIGAFLNRIDDMKPDLSIFLEDTELRMKDKVILMFEDELKRRFGKGSTPPHLDRRAFPTRCGGKKIYPVKRVLNEIFSINDRVFIINSKPHLAFNIGVCIKTLLTGRGL